MKLMIEIDNSIYDICKSVRNLPLDENDIMSSLIIQSIANGTPLTESDDCVSRQATYQKMLELQGKKRDRYLDIDDVRVVLQGMPSVQPKTKTGEWISVNDMLPSDCDCDWVLAQIQEDNGYMWIPCVAEYRKDKDDWLCEEHNVGWLKDHNGAFKVIAWMPLPEPYKAESEE